VSAILRFVGRMLFAPFFLLVVLILGAIVLVLLAAGVASVGCVFFAALLGICYWARHDPEMGRGAIEMLLSGVLLYALLVAVYGMIWDALVGVWNWSIRSNDEDFDETPPLRIEP